MKKSLLLFVSLFFLCPCFADSKNLVYNESFNFQNIDSIQISLTYEALKIQQIYGDEIVIEIGSNNIKKIPAVSLQKQDDEETCTLIIESPNKKKSPGHNCTVYLYLPQDFLPKTISILSQSGNIQADNLKAENAIHLKNISGRTDCASCSTDFLTAVSVSGNLTLQKINVGYMNINNTSGNIFLELEKPFEAKSTVTDVSGKIQVYYKKNESPFSDDSPDFVISTVSGKIETVPFD